MLNTSLYEMVVGLEVHVELKTKTKIFCACSTAFGAEPNTQCCPVCMGFPGTLPVLNEKVVEYALLAGLATNCEIARFSKQDRKNYFYPDLPKDYQISQYDLPLCAHGHLDITTAEGEKRVGITRIHIEEDAGKLVHTDGGRTLVDYNRCGVPLIEIVSEPDIRSAEEAVAYVRKLRAILLYLGVSDCRMNEGSLRCDVNLSVRRRGDQALGTRTEMKNLNSFQFIAKAIAYEFARQVGVLEEGGAVVQETRRFDAASGKTFSMRSKENSSDYRYFPDPDLAPIVTDDGMLDALKKRIPELPDERRRRYIEAYALPALDAEAICAVKELADYFDEAAARTRAPKILAGLIVSEVIRLMPQDGGEVTVTAKHLARVADMVDEGVLNLGTARELVRRLFSCDEDPDHVVAREGLSQITDEQALRDAAQQVLRENEKAAEDYRAGKVQALGAFIGQAMKRTRGRADPARLRAVFEKLLDE